MRLPQMNGAIKIAATESILEAIWTLIHTHTQTHIHIQRDIERDTAERNLLVQFRLALVGLVLLSK